MATLNKKKKVAPIFTHGGAKASRSSDNEALRRSVMSCMLWEKEFYESGETIANRIKGAIAKLSGNEVAAIAREARTKFKLRHIPLLLARELARGTVEQRLVVAELLGDIIQRPDELSEYLSIYWKDGKQSLSAQSKKGLAKAFGKFNEYSLSKYNKDGDIKLRDVLFLSHAKPQNKDQEKLWKRVVDNQLETPDTWEVALSGGADKKEAFTRLLQEGKLGALALLRNLRNMIEAKVDESLIIQGLDEMKTERVLPFRFISAAKYAPRLEPALERAMFRCLEGQPKFPGKTILIVDVSGSMQAPISGKSDLNRLDTAASVSVLIREMCDNPVIYCTAGSDWSRIHQTAIVPARRGFALKEAISPTMFSKLGGGGIFLTQCMDYVQKQEGEADRVIVLTDEQDCDTKLNPDKANAFGNKNYLINVASAQNGIAYNKFHHINGWSESVIDYIQAFESDN